MRTTLVIAALLVAAAPRAALAEDDHAGVVLGVEGDVVLVDLGAADGLVEGAELTVLHVVTAKDPVSKETLSDTFPLGALTVIRAGEHVAEARAEAGLGKRISVGDPVERASAATAVIDPWQVQVAASKRAPAPTRTRARVEPRPDASDAERRAVAERFVADAEAVRGVWQHTLGQPPAARIALWEALLAAAPDNVYADDVRAEIASLRAQDEALARAADAAPEDRATVRTRALATLDGRVRGAIAGDPPTRARGGHAVALAFLVVDPAATARAWLYARPRGAADYQRLPLTADGDGYVRAEIPAELVAPPGVEWFIEAVSADGEPAAVWADRQAPATIDVANAREPAYAQAGRSRVTLSGDYVDFDGGLGGGWDQYQQLELDFMYRFERPIYALRLGLGTLAGIGGPKDVIDADATDQCRDGDGTLRCRRLAFTYVYAEVELALSSKIALMIRPQAGRLTSDERTNGDVGDCLDGTPDPSCSISAGYGLRGRLRIGEERGTNLLLGAGFTQDVGTLLEAAYAWAPHVQVPVLLAVQVTDLPVPEDFGVRIVGDVGWRKLAWVYPSLRVSYQARDVDHAGFSGGLGLTFDW